jgi:hypothetical protein
MILRDLATLRAGQDIRQAGLRKDDVRMLIIEQVQRELTDSPYAKFDSGDLILPQRGGLPDKAWKYYRVTAALNRDIQSRH